MHAARQPVSWLIFDVRRFTVTTTRYHSRSHQASGSFPGSGHLRSAGAATDSIGRRDYHAWRCAHSSLSRRSPGVFEPYFRDREEELPVVTSEYSPFCSEVASSLRSPNKAPEPTRGAVTPRAPESCSECKNRDARHTIARGAPAPRVAHL